MSQTLLEKLQYKDERNLLIQGLPSSIEKQFVKLAFAKNLTPLLKTRKIDFALVFAVNEQQLGNIVRELLPALQRDAKFWVAYPKIGSKIATTLNRVCSWGCITGEGFESVREAALDHVWTAVRFRRSDAVSALAKAAIREVALESAGVNHVRRVVRPPADFANELRRSKVASSQTRTRRLGKPIDKLIAGKKNPAAK
ncbi:MAG TPA: hypothetical protein VFE32_17625 [Puia sp.]|jgi:hypothetical protein|nr:hypothetical protein [Puia sp.]